MESPPLPASSRTAAATEPPTVSPFEQIRARPDHTQVALVLQGRELRVQGPGRFGQSLVELHPDGDVLWFDQARSVVWLGLPDEVQILDLRTASPTPVTVATGMSSCAGAVSLRWHSSSRVAKLGVPSPKSTSCTFSWKDGTLSVDVERGWHGSDEQVDQTRKAVQITSSGQDWAASMGRRAELPPGKRKKCDATRPDLQSGVWSMFGGSCSPKTGSCGCVTELPGSPWMEVVATFQADRHGDYWDKHGCVLTDGRAVTIPDRLFAREPHPGLAVDPGAGKRSAPPPNLSPYPCGEHDFSGRGAGFEVSSDSVWLAHGTQLCELKTQKCTDVGRVLGFVMGSHRVGL